MLHLWKKIKLLKKCANMKHYRACLVSNVCRLFSKNNKYDYEKLLGYSYKNDKSIFLSVLLMNILLFSISIAVDVLCIVFGIFYWWGVLIRIPLAVLSIFSYQVYKDKGLTIFEIILFLLATFIPCYSAYLILYVVGRAYIAEADYYPINEN